MEATQVVSSLFQAISIILAAVSVFAGMTAWRRSLLGQKKLELAEETLEDFYRARDAISAIRDPLSFGGEGSSRARRDSETDEESRILDLAYVVIERYQKHSELFSRIDSRKYRFAIYFGQDKLAHFHELRSIIMKIIHASNSLSRSWMDQGRRTFTDEEYTKHLERMHKAEAVFWEGGGPDGIDPIKEKLDPLIDQIERVCKSAIDKASR